ncbi:hypothetical protein [Aureimonas jatrophae]|jgi:hypothetical protein|uniref:DUF5666 domain-containing protein n=1 Tax=Aureimonas jatrophae TaxID=1166073 RepID=A0A1H0K0R8_9HYPH|nr:hypothetical protein [Aureimonas jatrophae]MBB3950883.1 hypothetical protein [Aureimonas jatrophae]SDO49241.1 hypothetical protein SAMN05192530_10729 [Aureimonas jatrophae]
MHRSVRTALVLLGSLAVSTSLAAAQDGQPSRVRGTIAAVDGNTLSVTSREGPVVTITMAPDVGVRGVTAASAGDIKPGDYVGAATLPGEGGRAGALEVLIFPAAMKGANEGSFPWDLQPGSTMTNATVSNAVESVSGRELTLTYPTGSKQITLPANVPVVTFAEATKADLKPGAPVFVPATKAADGSLTTAFVVVGNQGVVPPM